MAIQSYFQRKSIYHDHALAWLRAKNAATSGQTNFDFLMANVGTVLTWETGDWNKSAPYTRHNNRTERLILGPIGNLAEHGGVGTLKAIGKDEFFYVDGNTPLDEAPKNAQDTPFIIRGIATALRDCLSRPVDGPNFNNRFYKVRFRNHVLEITRC
jgi:hypothetical protein